MHINKVSVICLQHHTFSTTVAALIVILQCVVPNNCFYDL